MSDQLTQDYKETFGSVHGRWVLDNLKMLSHFNTAFVPKGNDGHVDAFEMCREEGKRSVIVHIERMLNKDPWKEADGGKTYLERNFKLIDKSPWKEGVTNG